LLTWPWGRDQAEVEIIPPLKRPRFTIRAIMIAVAVAAVLFMLCTVGVREPPGMRVVLPPQHATAVGGPGARLPEISDGEPEPPMDDVR
jgi:hypothetical protein